MMNSRIRTRNQYVILPPVKGPVSEAFRNVHYDGKRHGNLLAEMQRLRGGIYAADGAIRPEDLTADGRHKSPVDELSWHVLALNDQGKVCACLRYLEEKHVKSFNDLRVRHAALARSPVLGQRFRTAVERELERSRQMKIGFGEVGGWAVSEECRWSLEPLRIVLATFGVLELLGRCAGVATATMRHNSATILRKIGLSSLQVDGVDLPPYYDPQYCCDMEVLRFDSRHPNPKYRDWVDEFAYSLSSAPVISAGRPRANMQDVLRGFDVPVGSVPQAAMVPVH